MNWKDCEKTQWDFIWGNNPWWAISVAAHSKVRLLELWDRISPGHGCLSVVVCCVVSGRGHCVGLITRPEESDQVWCVWIWMWNLDNEVLANKGCVAILGGVEIKLIIVFCAPWSFPSNSLNRPTSWYVVFFSFSWSTPVMSRSPVLILVNDIIIGIQICGAVY